MSGGRFATLNRLLTQEDRNDGPYIWSLSLSCTPSGGPFRSLLLKCIRKRTGPQLFQCHPPVATAFSVRVGPGYDDGGTSNPSFARTSRRKSSCTGLSHIITHKTTFVLAPFDQWRFRGKRRYMDVKDPPAGGSTLRERASLPDHYFMR